MYKEVYEQGQALRIEGKEGRRKSRKKYMEKKENVPGMEEEKKKGDIKIDTEKKI